MHLACYANSMKTSCFSHANTIWGPMNSWLNITPYIFTQEQQQPPSIFGLHTSLFKSKNTITFKIFHLNENTQTVIVTSSCRNTTKSHTDNPDIPEQESCTQFYLCNTIYYLASSPFHHNTLCRGWEMKGGIRWVKYDVMKMSWGVLHCISWLICAHNVIFHPSNDPSHLLTHA
jgi:hypothetical protein